MASSSIFLPLPLLLLFTLLPTPSLSSTPCTSHKFTTPNKSFTTCLTLPSLNAFLHYTYTPKTSSLSVAFTANTTSTGWIAYALNPTPTPAMAGSQALLAYRKPSTGSVSVYTYDIQSYSSLTKGPISYKVTGLSGESRSAGGSTTTITIFATWDLSDHAGETEVNHVWQVGPSVSTNGAPAKHAFAPENLAAKGKLDLTKGVVGGGSGGPAASPEASAVSGGPVEGPGSSTGAAVTAGESGAPGPAPAGSGAGESVVNGFLGVTVGLVLGVFGNFLV